MDRLDDASELPGSAVAVIGMAGRFPGAADVGQFWDNLLAGREGIRFFTPDELDPSVPASLRADPNYVPARGVVDDCDKFDAEFFGIAPIEAQVMDPQQRIMLELAWAALENSGHNPSAMPGLTGVYAGMNWNRYRAHCVAGHPEVVSRFGEFNAALANEYDFLATRISYKLNLRGPSVNIATACSTSLVAIAQAAQALLNHECDFALAGGASITVPVQAGYLHQEESMLSADGHCRAFDARGTGTTFNDGAAFVVLRRLSDALEAGDRIVAIVRGFAVNNDGADKVSFTAPSVEGQAEVIRSAIDFAGVDPSTIGFIEAHGTATPLGDPIEVAALKKVFTTEAMQGNRCALGSVKSSVGHLIHAAGVAGFIKAALAVSSGKIPPTLFFQTANPRLRLEESPFYVNARLEDWTPSNHPRRAGVSSFGVGGTNAHAILEQPPLMEASAPTEGPQLLRLSARTQTALEAMAAQLAKRLESDPELNLADAAYTLASGRAEFGQRLVVAADSPTRAAQALSDRADPQRAERTAPDAAPFLVWVFPGQGAQYAGMGRELYERDSAFRAAIDECIQAFGSVLGYDLLARMFGDDGEALRPTGTTQPAIFCIEYALARTWQSKGFAPQALIGHSVGEFVAAVLAGIMSLESAAHLVARRGALIEALPSGAMLSVRMGAEALKPHLNAEVALAASNGPSACVVSGTHEAIEAFAKHLEKENIAHRLLHTSHAFHSPMMDAALVPFAAEVAQVKLASPFLPIASTLTGQWLTGKEAADPSYWTRHLREPVLFSPAVRTVLAGHPDAAFLEAGPRGTLATLIRQHPIAGKPAPVAIPSLGESPTSETWQILLAEGQLWTLGIEPAKPFDPSPPKRRLRVDLPTYPFERKRYWLDASPSTVTGSAPPVAQNDPSAKVPTNSGEPHQNGRVALPEVIATPGAGENRIAKIRAVFEDLSGLDMSGIGDQVRFVELGFDSLTLTQAAQQLKRAFGVSIKFRQLMEDLATLGSLAAFLDAGQSKAEAPTESTAPPPASTTASAASRPASSHPTIQGEAKRTDYDVKKAFGAIARIHTKGGEITELQKNALNTFARKYIEKTKSSKRYTEIHRPHTADPRVVNGFRPATKEITYQIVVERSRGSRLWDIDGNEYVDVLNGFGMNLFGWRPDFINEALHAQLDRGYEIGPQHALTGEVSRLLCELTGFDRVGLCNTGSEAVMAAMRIARTVTGRDTIALFTGSYHGTFDEVLVRAGRSHQGVPAAPGILPGMFGEVRVLDYGTDESLAYLREHAADLAAILVEPVQSRRPDFQPREFLQELRTLTSSTGTCLIFDEVITGFRSHLGGVQALFGIQADLATYGKVIGGGLPIGAVAGKRDFMDALDGGAWNFGDASVPTVGVTYFAGTFVRHPLALAAAKAALEHLKSSGHELQITLNRSTAAMAEEMNAFCRKVGAPVEVVHFASLWRVKWLQDLPYQDLLFAQMRLRGIHILDNFPCFLTTAHSAADIALIVAAFRESLTELLDHGFLPRKAKPVEAFDAARPPVPGARLGRDAEGKPAWFVPHPKQPGKYLMVNAP